MKLHHIVARAWREFKPLRDPVVCAWLWERLRNRFPLAAATTFIPDHVHLLAPGSPAELRVRLANTLRWVSRKFFKGKEIWEPVPEPVRIPNERHLLRQIRYVHLNACREGLVKDPLAWEWSTHREWCGFSALPWVDTRQYTRMLGWRESDSAERMHRYVSSDPSVSPSGTPLLFPGSRVPLERVGDAQLVRRAIEIAFRARPGAASKGELRRLAIGFMLRQSGRKVAEIARDFGVSAQAVWNLRVTSSSEVAQDQALLRILGDERVIGPYLRSWQRVNLSDGLLERSEKRTLAETTQRH